MPRNEALLGGNTLKLGLFGPNCSSGRSYITAPERWETSWDNNVRLAQLADSLGIEALIPIARWQGYGGDTDPNGTSWESITWACGLLGVTKRLNVFATMHVPLYAPLLAAKQMATADQIGRGRFGVNVVCGWNEDEFRMFGVELGEHGDRYAQGEEWWTIIRRVWREDEPFDYDGVFYRLWGVRGWPKPYTREGPIMMNAGSSAAGQRFGLCHSDMYFLGFRTIEDGGKRLAAARQQTQAMRRSVQYWTPAGIVCRPTQREAEEFSDYVVSHADMGAVGNLLELQDRDPRARDGHHLDYGQSPLRRRVLARGSYCAIGTPDLVADELVRLHAAGFDGLAMNFVNYLNELPYFAQEILPRLESRGLRQKAPA